MTLFTSKQEMPFVVTEKDLTRTFKENVLITCDMRKGQKKASVLGTDRKQMSLDVGEQIMAAMVADYDKHNGKLDKALATLYYAKGQRVWVSQKLSTMAHFKASATGGNAVERLWNATSDLIITGRSTKGLNIYCRADTATQVEFHAYLGIIRRRVIIADATGNRAITLVLAGAEAIGDRTLEQAYAEECERYRAESEVA
jgi:hypothetical protein